MPIIIRLKGLPLSAKASDIRDFFCNLKIPKGAVNIVGGPNGEAFIGFSTDEDARLAMSFDGRVLHDSKIRLFLSSKQEMETVIANAHSMALNLKNSVPPGLAFPPPPVLGGPPPSGPLTLSRPPGNAYTNSGSGGKQNKPTSYSNDLTANETTNVWKHTDYKVAEADSSSPSHTSKQQKNTNNSSQSFDSWKSGPLVKPSSTSTSSISSFHVPVFSAPTLQKPQSLLSLSNTNSQFNRRDNNNYQEGSSGKQSRVSSQHHGDSRVRTTRSEYNHREKRKRSRSPFEDKSDEAKRSFSDQDFDRRPARFCIQLSNIPFKATFIDVKNFLISTSAECNNLSKIARVYPDDKNQSDKWVAEFNNERDARAVVLSQAEIKDRKIRAEFIDPRNADDLYASLEPESGFKKCTNEDSNQAKVAFHDIWKPVDASHSQTEPVFVDPTSKLPPKIALQASTEEELITRGELPPQSFGAFSTPSFATQGFVRKVAPIQTGFGFQERPFLRPQIPQMPMPMQRQNFSNRPRFQKFQNRGFRPHTQSGGTNFRGGFQHRNNDKFSTQNKNWNQGSSNSWKIGDGFSSKTADDEHAKNNDTDARSDQHS